MFAIRHSPPVLPLVVVLFGIGIVLASLDYRTAGAVLPVAVLLGMLGFGAIAFALADVWTPWARWLPTSPKTRTLLLWLVLLAVYGCLTLARYAIGYLRQS